MKAVAKKKAAPGKATKAASKKNGRKLEAIIVERDRTGDLTGEVLDHLYNVVLGRRDADPQTSHSARLLSRGPAKVAQKFGEEAVEAVIEGAAGNRAALIAESADVLYHLAVLWVSAGVEPADVWAELRRREGVSGLAEKAARRLMPALGTRKIP